MLINTASNPTIIKNKRYKLAVYEFCKHVYNKRTLAAAYGLEYRAINARIKRIPNFGEYIGKQFSYKQLRLYVKKYGLPPSNSNLPKPTKTYQI